MAQRPGANANERKRRLTEDALEMLETALQNWWQQATEAERGFHKRLTREAKAYRLGCGLNTVDRIFGKVPVHPNTLHSVFGSAGLSWKPEFLEPPAGKPETEPISQDLQPSGTQGIGASQDLLVRAPYTADDFLTSAAPMGLPLGHLADYYAHWLDQMLPPLQSQDQAASLARIEQEHPHILKALAWEAQHLSKPRLINKRALRIYWHHHPRPAALREWIQCQALPPKTARGKIRAHTLIVLGGFSIAISDLETAEALLQEALELFRAFEDQSYIAGALCNLGYLASRRGDYLQAHGYGEEALAIYRALGDTPRIADHLVGLAHNARRLGDFAASRMLLEEAEVLYHGLNDARGIAAVCQEQGQTHTAEGTFPSAIACFQQAIQQWRRLRDMTELAITLFLLGDLYRQTGAFQAARDALRESLTLYREQEQLTGVIEGLRYFARLAAAEGQGERAAQFAGAEDALREQTGRCVPPNDRTLHAQERAALQALLTKAAFTAAWQEGHEMDWEQAVAYALEKDQRI